ncbi:TlpA disulfide reductase family protein [Isosphaeraceae bacterium EP7]
MTTQTRQTLRALAPALWLGCLAGCLGEGSQNTVNPTPSTVLNPAAPDEPKPAEVKAIESTPAGIQPIESTPAKAAPEAEPKPVTETAHSEPTKGVTPVDLGAIAAAPAAPEAAAGEISLIPVKFDAYLARIKANKKAKYSMVDAWATWCAPCKENFPHVVEMHKKYADKGLAVYSLSLDHPDVPADLAEARKFLKEQKATLTNLLLDEEEEPAFEKLNINAIPAVFIFGPDGAELKRFTMDDVENQFTYEEVEKYVAGLLEGPAPKGTAAP